MLLQMLHQEAVKNSDKKIARNETCPCGSGKNTNNVVEKVVLKIGLVASGN